MRGLSWRNFDFLLLGAAVLASAFGAMMIRSAIAGNENLAGYDSRQVYFAMAGAARHRPAGEHRLSILAVGPLADLHRHDAVPDVALRIGAGGIRCTALVPGGRAVRPADRVCQGGHHPGAGAVFREEPARAARPAVAAEEPGVGVGSRDLDPAAAEPVERDRGDVHLGRRWCG